MTPQRDLIRRVQEAERALREIAKTTPNVHGYGVAVLTAPQMNALAVAVLGGDVQEQETTTDSGDDRLRVRRSGGGS